MLLVLVTGFALQAKLCARASGKGNGSQCVRVPSEDFLNGLSDFHKHRSKIRTTEIQIDMTP